MTEKQIGFLYNIASILSHRDKNDSGRILESYYLMRCKDITKGYGLPTKYFSSSTRCSHCCLEWKKETKTLIKQTRLSKRQKKRIRSQIKKINTKGKKNLKRQHNLLFCNKIEQICSFCKKSTAMPILKAQNKQDNIVERTEISMKNEKLTNLVHTGNVIPTFKTNKSVANVYSLSKDVFSLKNEKNNLSNAFKDMPKVIKNNKKKKDKFAGLCEKAVLASAKLKAEKEKECKMTKESEISDKSKKNKLSLFLRPSV